MVDFTLTDENRLVRDAARAFAEAEILPHIREWDEKGEVHREVFDEMGELGFLGAPIPERYGGAGMDYVSLRAPVRGAGAGRHGVPGGPERPRRAQLPDAPPVGDGGAAPALARAPGARGEARDVRAHRAGRRHRRRQPEYDRAPRRRRYVLNGHKIWISLADIADHFLVFATVDRGEEAQGRDGVPARAGDARPHHRHAPRQARDPGRQHRPHRPRRRARAGREPDRRGGRGLLDRDERDRPGAVHGRRGRRRAGPGVPRRVASAYAHERQTFGEEIGDHQLVKQMLAKMAKGTEIGRLLVWQAGWLKNQGVRNTRET